MVNPHRLLPLTLDSIVHQSLKKGCPEAKARRDANVLMYHLHGDPGQQQAAEEKLSMLFSDPLPLAQAA